MNPRRPNPARSDAQGPSSVEPAVRFLGPGASRNGPFGVLGLPVSAVSEAEVLDAVHHAMGRIDAHPEAMTPAANEARLAVHAAAANLLDRSVLAELLKRLHAENTASSLAGGERSEQRRIPASHSSPGLEADLIRCIAAEGGWSRHAMNRYLKVAHAKGHSSAEAMRAIEHMVGSPVEGRLAAPDLSDPAARHSPASVAIQPTNRGVERPIDHPSEPPIKAPITQPGHQRKIQHDADLPGSPMPAEEPQAGLTALGAVLLIVAVFLLMGAVAWFVLSAMDPGEPGLDARRPDVVVPRTEEVVEAGPLAESKADPMHSAARPLDNGPAITHQLEVATEGLGLDTQGAMVAYEEAVDALGLRWVAIPLADRQSAQDQIVGFLYRVSGQSALTARAFDAIEAGIAAIGAPIDPPSGDPAADPEALAPADITRGVWSMGTLVRLRREQNLPSSVLRRIDRAMLRSPDGLGPNAMTFRAGAVSALRSIADRLAGVRGAPTTPKRTAEWNAWTEAARAATAGDGALLDSMVIAAAEAVLRGPSAPDSDVIGLLMETLSWRAGGAARSWVSRAFADRSLGSDDLHAVTQAVATRSRADGIDPSMVLPRGAGDAQRRALGERYRAAWGLDAGADQDESIAAFLGAAAEDLREPPPSGGRDEVDVLAAVVRTARLNAAATLLWRADTSEAIALLGALDEPIDAVRAGGGAADVSDLFAARTGTWAESYIDAGAHIPRRLSLLDTLANRGGSLEPMEAEVVVTEALRGSPQDVRDRAAAIIESSAQQPAVINAVLKSLPMMPRTDRNARLVEIVSGVSLPDADSATYPIDARRALVERLLESIAGHGIYARLDALAGLLGEAYSIRFNGAAPGGGSSSASSAAVPAAQTARVLTDRWATDAATRAPAGLAGLGTDEIDRRRAARRSMTSGLVQEFHAEQLALFEMMAQVIAGEQPDRVRQIRGLVDAVSRERAAARDVLIQIELVERAMLELWRVRFGEVTG